MGKIRTRFAPSPTGFLHIGGARTALFNWLYSRHHGGEFVLRIEDTDQQRSTDESTKAILDAMTWLALNWDDGPYIQAQRVELHRDMVQKLINEGKAYYCTCTPEELEAKRKQALTTGKKPKYDGTCRSLPPAEALARVRAGEPAVVRLKLPTEGTNNGRRVRPVLARISGMCLCLRPSAYNS